VAPLQGAGERSLRSGGLRYASTTGSQSQMISTLKGWQKTVAPLQGAGERSLPSGGLRSAPTTGYYLTAFQAEDALVFTKSR
jgi:hypothetical protein